MIGISILYGVTFLIIIEVVFWAVFGCSVVKKMIRRQGEDKLD
jgi:hypothetical protein